MYKHIYIYIYIHIYIHIIFFLNDIGNLGVDCDLHKVITYTFSICGELSTKSNDLFKMVISFENTVKNLVDRYYDLFLVHWNNENEKTQNKMMKVNNLCEFLLSIIDKYCSITLGINSDYFLIKILLILTLASTKHEIADNHIDNTNNNNSNDNSNDSNNDNYTNYDNDHNDNQNNNKIIDNLIIIARNMIIDGIISVYEILPQNCTEIFSNYGQHWDEYHSNMESNNKNECKYEKYTNENEVNFNFFLENQKSGNIKQYENNPSSIKSNMKQIQLLKTSIRFQLLLSLFDITLLNTDIRNTDTDINNTDIHNTHIHNTAIRNMGASGLSSSSSISSYQNKKNKDSLLYKSILRLSTNCVRIIPLLAITIRSSLLFGCMNYRYDLVKLILCNPPHFNLKYLTEIYEKFQNISKIKKIKKIENLNNHSNNNNVINNINDLKIESTKGNDHNNFTGKTPVDSVGYLMNRGQIYSNQGIYV
jgi:hypothetical protein